MHSMKFYLVSHFLSSACKRLFLSRILLWGQVSANPTIEFKETSQECKRLKILVIISKLLLGLAYEYMINLGIFKSLGVSLVTNLEW